MKPYRRITLGLLVLTALCGFWLTFRWPAHSAYDIGQPVVDRGIYGHVAHAGWVMKDLDLVLSCWERLGIHDIERHGLVETPEVTYRGKKTAWKLKTATAKIGNAEIDWIQPVTGDSTCADFLRKHGDGIHHLAFRVSSQTQLEEQVRYFAGRGVGPLETGSWVGKNGTGRYVYLDTASRGGGITIELIYDPDKVATPASASRNESVHANRPIRFRGPGPFEGQRFLQGPGLRRNGQRPVRRPGPPISWSAQQLRNGFGPVEVGRCPL
ncbi:MAG: hypothetical protein DMG21_01160 [Acidobacteria bacterium]|nr:MAG: hypothetical protein DMG21_01160 [Acidobacteriota bacterium]